MHSHPEVLVLSGFFNDSDANGRITQATLAAAYWQITHQGTLSGKQQPLSPCPSPYDHRCLRDMCPHRLAPLSEGRIEPSTQKLYCNYHGWQFDGAGQCTSIPQLAPGAAINQKASCVASYPTKEAEELLWVWADAGPGAEQEAAAAPWRGVAPQLDQYGAAAFASNRGWYFR
jgi:nitrite reductase/ring-hydroxylating ferredoxin subunit